MSQGAGVLAGLVVDGKVGEVTVAFERAIAASFLVRPHFLHLTKQSAVKDRFDICVRIFRALRGDMKWSLPKTLDHLPEFLLNALDGEDWEQKAKALDDVSLWRAPETSAAE